MGHPPTGQASRSSWTAREHDVLTLIAQGASNTAIAQGLGIGCVATVATDVSIFVGAATRAEAIVRVGEAGTGDDHPAHWPGALAVGLIGVARRHLPDLGNRVSWVTACAAR